MSDRLFVYLVCAEEAFIARHKEWLGVSADLNVFRSTFECRAALAARHPDLLFIDTALPEDSGFRLHRELREDFDTSDLYQVLLCTAEDVGREGYGADDQLIKPLEEAVFRRKFAQIEKVFADKAAVREQMNYAQSVAFTSMSAMGELGVVMQFLSQSFACHNIQSVAALAVESLRQYELDGVVSLIWEGDSMALCTLGTPPEPAALALIEQRRLLGRVLEIDSNLVVNFPHVSILIRHLPQDDSQRLGRIRDNIATLAEGIESRIAALLLEHDNTLKQQGIRYAAWEIRDSVKNLEERQIADLGNTRELISRVIDEFEDTFLHMGMMPEIENQLIGELVELRRKIADIVGRPSEVHEKLRTVIMALETMASNVGAPEPLISSA